MRRTTLACLIVVTTIGPAGAQDDQRWGFVRAGANDVRLFYGLPESDVVTFSIICNPKRTNLRIVDLALPRSARAGQTLRITLTAGSSTAAYDGKVVRDRIHGGIYVEATMRADTRIFDLLNLAPSLTVAIGATRDTISLKNIAEPLAKMERACVGKR